MVVSRLSCGVTHFVVWSGFMFMWIFLYTFSEATADFVNLLELRLCAYEFVASLPSCGFLVDGKLLTALIACPLRFLFRDSEIAVVGSFISEIRRGRRGTPFGPLLPAMGKGEVLRPSLSSAFPVGYVDGMHLFITQSCSLEALECCRYIGLILRCYCCGWFYVVDTI